MTDRTSDKLTAREALHREAQWGLLGAGFDDAATEADRLIDAYAHELAEKIRDSLGGDGGFPDGMNHAADLIDPEATHVSCGGTHVRSASGAAVVCDKQGSSTDGR